MLCLGYDVGGTKTEAALIYFHNVHSSHPDFEVLGKMRLPTDRALGYEHLLSVFESIARQLLAKHGKTVEDLSNIGFGLPGSVSPTNHAMIQGNTQILVNQNVIDDFRRGMNIPSHIGIFAANDANCFALAETYFGVGQSFSRDYDISIQDLTAIGIILGTGCGGGMITHGKIFRGTRGGGLEVGHTIFRAGGSPCYCGKQGCAEAYISGSGLEASFQQKVYSQVNHVKSAREIFELYETGEPSSIGIIKQYQRHLGEFIGNLTTILDPHFFVLGGGLSLQPRIYEGLEARVQQHAFIDQPVPVFRNDLGDSSGVIGAAWLSAVHHDNELALDMD